MKSKRNKTIQILLASLFLSAFLLPFFVSSVQAQENKKPYPCMKYDSCMSLGNQKDIAVDFIDNKDSRANKCGSDEGRCIVKSANVKLNVPIPKLGGGTVPTVNNIDQYVSRLFNWLLQLGGVVAAMVIVWGGYIYITAAGNQARVSQAKETITGGIIGLVLLFGSVTLLGFLNSRIQEQMPIAIDVVSEERYNSGFCDLDKIPASSKEKTTCGEIIKDTDGAKCISSYCSGGDVCVPNILKIGGVGLTNSGQAGYKCVKKDKDVLEEICKESAGISNPDHCTYISKILKEVGSPQYACAFGNNKDGDNQCYFRKQPMDCVDTTKRLPCDTGCGSTDNISQYLQGDFVKVGSFSPYYGKFVENNSSLGRSRFFCADPGVEQVEWVYVDKSSSIWLTTYGSVCCQGADGKSFFKAKTTLSPL